MKIIQIISSLGLGGAERLVVDLCNELGRNNDVILCSLQPITENDFYGNEIEKYIRVVSLNKLRGVKLLFVFKLYKFLRKEQPHIVHSHLASTFHYLAFSIFLLKRIKFFHTIHTLAHKEEGIKIVWLIRKLLLKINKIHFISISEEVNRSFKEVINSESPIVYNGRPIIYKTSLFDNTKKEIDSLKLDEETKVFLSVGRIEEQKNHKLLIAAFKQANIDNAVLIILGRDYSEDQYHTKELLRSANERTFLLGVKSNVVDYMLLSDVFCLSSLYEGMPITIIEALSLRLPIISTAVGGIPDMIKNDINGIFVDDLSIDSFKMAIEKFYYLNKEIVNKINSNNISLYNDNFCISKTTKEYLFLYQQ